MLPLVGPLHEAGGFARACIQAINQSVIPSFLQVHLPFEDFLRHERGHADLANLLYTSAEKLRQVRAQLNSAAMCACVLRGGPLLDMVVSMICMAAHRHRQMQHGLGVHLLCAYPQQAGARCSLSYY